MLRIGVLTLAAAAALLSFRSLALFPPVGIDEIGLAAMGEHWLDTGRLRYPLSDTVVHPHFADLAGASEAAVRTLHYGWIGLLSKASGHSYVALRAASWLLWLIAGVLLWRVTSIRFGIVAGVAAAVGWAASLDAFLAAHLVRPEIYLALIGLIQTIVLTRPVLSRWTSALAGALGAAAMIGIHLNGLLNVGLAGVLVLYNVWKRRAHWTAVLWFSGGFTAMSAVLLLSADWESLATARFALLSQKVVDRSGDWLSRLNPFRLGARTFLLFARPNSFYVPESIRDADLWRAAGTATAALYGSTLLWLAARRPHAPGLGGWILAAAFALAALGFGAFRPEFTYLVSASILAIPLAALGAAYGGRDGATISANRRRGFPFRALVLGFAASFAVLLAFFRTEPLFFLLVAIALLALEGAGDRILLAVIAAALGILFYVWIEAAPHMRALQADLLARVRSPAALVAIGGAAGVIGCGIPLARAGGDAGQARRRIAGTMFAALFLWWVALSAGLTLRLNAVALREGESLNRTYDRLSKLAGPAPGTLLAPAYLWFGFPSDFHDLGGIATDWFFAGRKRPSDAIARVRPDIVVVDRPFRDRFQWTRDPAGTVYAVPFERLAPAPVVRLGVLPPTSHHAALEVYRLHWPDMEATPASPRP